MGDKRSHTDPFVAAGETGPHSCLPGGKKVDAQASANRSGQVSQHPPAVWRRARPKGSTRLSAESAGFVAVVAWDDGQAQVGEEQGYGHSVDPGAHTDRTRVVEGQVSDSAERRLAASADTKARKTIRPPLFVFGQVETTVPDTRPDVSFERDCKGCRDEPDRSDVGRSTSRFDPRHHSFAA